MKIAEICKISENSVGKYCKALRILMACECEKISKLSGEIEIDESFFGAGRVRGKRGRGAGGKTIVFQGTPLRLFGMLKQAEALGLPMFLVKRDGNVYTQVVKNCSSNEVSRKELMPDICAFSDVEGSVYQSDSWKAYDGLVDYGALAHHRVKHNKNEFANGRNHINGIENVSRNAASLSKKLCFVSRNVASLCLGVLQTTFKQI